MSGAVTSGPPDKKIREEESVEENAEESVTGEPLKQEESKQAQSPACATDFLIASKQCEILSLENFRRMGKLVVAISELVHALQRERGSSNLYLGSCGARYGEWLATMIADSDEKLDHFHATLVELSTDTSAAPGDGRLFSRIAYAVHALSELSVLRARVQPQTLNPAPGIGSRQAALDEAPQYDGRGGLSLVAADSHESEPTAGGRGSGNGGHCRCVAPSDKFDEPMSFSA